ncbi:MAG: MoaD/ThiS family protein [Acidobacteriota bacterium]|nr:MoaD/ThiS family protein [Acidobacteriota bacterium]
MKIRVQLFASYREAVGKEWIEQELPAGARVQDLLESVGSRHGLSLSPGRTLVARNLEYVGAETLLEEGDELVLLPPLSGGA